MKDKILVWLARGKVGIRSKVMACVAADIPIENIYQNTPYDPADLNRCLLLLDFVPEIREHFSKIAEVSDQWGIIIKHWSEIEKCFLAEVGFDWCKGGKAIKTYNLMKSFR